jgi:coenzyme F420-0:L-glutamate ligase/coenzyme F420-1:gamma-L-glutamate ligase
MSIVITPLRGVPLIKAGDDLLAILLASLEDSGISLNSDDILVLAQKIISKAEGRVVDLATITPSARARDLAAQVQKDARLVELILQESASVLRARDGIIICRHRLGFVCANAGIDHSNVAGEATSEGDFVALLPEDPDRSSGRLREGVEARTGKRIGVMIIDSHGRPWRMGTVGVCIGLSGIPALIDERGWVDLFGYKLRSTVVGVGDELAAAASLAMGQAAEATPAVHVRGFPYELAAGRLSQLIRPLKDDLFP